ncbi:MAG: sugar phosphate isomerase/epimerase [Clostridia bacterium]|jgi:sugar phosphate isomerase/epimerase|nr:sugar phosphate isomerase/epimerase [Clostridia bacterium]MBO7658330.1 sugar phosphate isomerase/epimerase [Clostridia bacterium]MBP5665082.1 sugar phosphate isomerase/epimerase [Clostridia bacterium]MBP5765614.1 sugar phosphate isomerase/epimerase [Clostridia bacterium]
MKIGIISVLLGDLSTAEAMKYLADAGAECVEIGCGGYPGNAHCKPEILLHDEKAFGEFKQAVYGNGLEISALSCHGNPVHPNKEIAKKYHDDFINTILMCEKLGVDTIIGFSGCPGDCPDSQYPNWVTCAWPDDYPKILDWQWNEVLIPYWKKTAAFAAEHGIKKIAFEMHPGFCVYNPETLLKLRAAVGPIIGANLDPSHLVWQGIDVPEAIRYLGEAVYYVHGKDVRVDKANVAKNGVLDTKSYGDILNRSWVFRTLGYGNDYTYWKDIVSMLRTVGYDGVISIEHEDGLMSPQEGLRKAIAFLKEVLVKEPAGEMYWA